jgi:hypothetical protein
MPELTINFELKSGKRAIVLHPKESCRKCHGRGVTGRVRKPTDGRDMPATGQWIICKCVCGEYEREMIIMRREVDAMTALKTQEVPA